MHWLAQVRLCDMAGKEATVRRVDWKGHLKVLRLANASDRILVPRSACVTSGDLIHVTPGSLTLKSREGDVRILPSYFDKASVLVGRHRIEVAIKEITERGEHESYRHLSFLHYRGHELHGRTARLIIRNFHPLHPPVLGYVELATPFLMNKPRAQVLDAPFSDGQVSWDRWQKSQVQKNIHRLVRIARLVISPEFRGLGLSQLLVQHACEFARSRWQVAGTRPLFIEISADMLRFVPFAAKAGMTYVGETQGNLHRVAADMRYLIGRFGGNKRGQPDFERLSGICDEQVSRMSRALEVMANEGIDLPDFLRRLSSPGKQLPLRDHHLFDGIVSLPKPHFMKGLSPLAEKFLRARAEELELTPPPPHPPQTIAPMLDDIRVETLSIAFASKVRRTQVTHAVQQAFGLSPDKLRSCVIDKLSLVIQPGEIWLLTGPSGSGKSSLLNAISRTFEGRPQEFASGKIRIPNSATLGKFQPTRSTKALIEQVASEGVERGLHVLGYAGLSEAALYLRRFDELSAGQQYRAMLALLLNSKHNVWIADEFCSNLDPITAWIVAHSLQKWARAVGATVILAAADAEHIVPALSPDRVLILRNTTEHLLLTGAEFMAFNPNLREQTVEVPECSAPKFILKRLESGEATTWFVPTNSAPVDDIVIVRHGTDWHPAWLERSSKAPLESISDHDAHEVGYSNAMTLRRAINARYKLNGEIVAIERILLRPLGSLHS